MYKFFFLFFFPVFLFTSCEDDDPVQEINWYIPPPETSFDWDLRSDILDGTTYDATVVDIDAFDNEADLIASLQAQGKKVFAYVSVGSFEDWRSDADDFPTAVIGNEYPGWDGERFLDIKNLEALKPIMIARFDMIKAKGFDGIEPDNIDLNSWTTAELGFDITDEDVITYCTWLAEEAHSRGLSIGQKNATDLAGDLVNIFDWILLEDAFVYGFQDEATIYIEHNKAVFATEYTDEIDAATFQENVCPQAATLKYTAILKNRDLDAFVETCN